jgi:alkylation response protein AidB-like acyl-CoA dehydrogenase
MQVQLDEEQLLLRDTARDFLAAECPIDLVRAGLEDPHAPVDKLWKQMAALGWVGLHAPVEAGGAGLDLVSLSLILEELGRVLAPTPFLGTALLAVGSLTRFGSAAQKSIWLPGLAAGDHRVALAHLEDTASWSAADVGCDARRDGAGFRLRGRKRFVQDGLTSDLLLVSVRLGPAPDAVGLALVDAAATGVRRRAIDLYEMTRGWAEIELEDVIIDESAVLGAGGDGAAALAHLLDLARVGLASELAGAARRVLEMSVAFAKQREQFGQPIGAFQAIAHKCADMLVAVESMTSAAQYAVWSVGADEPDARTSACLAKSFCAEAYTKVAGDGIQVHGGLGFTWEQDLHLYFKHAKAAEFLYGHAHDLRELAARDLIDGEGPSPYLELTRSR